MDPKEFDRWYDEKVEEATKKLPHPSKIPNNEIEILIPLFVTQELVTVAPSSQFVQVHRLRFRKGRNIKREQIWIRMKSTR